MLNVHMYSSATKVKGQGVGSAYTELIKLLEKYYPEQLAITINEFSPADISHYHTIDLKFFFSTFSKRRGKKVGYVHFLPETLEGSLKLPWIARKVLYRYVIAFYKRMDALVVVNPTFIPKLEAYGIAREKITYIPNFVSKKEFHPIASEEKKQLRVKKKLPTDKFLIVGVGQIQERKGVFDFIELAKRNPEFEFVWVGGFSFGVVTDGYAELKKVVDDPPENLHFPGIVERTEMCEYYNLADVFLLPSYNELFPMSVLEAFSCETPVVLRELELYEGVIAGYYAGCADIDEMEKKLKKLAKDPAVLAKLRERAKAAAKFYSEDRLALIWLDYYKKQAGKV